MYSRLALLLYVITKCYCFPTFKDLFGILPPHFLIGSAKVAVIFIPPNFSSDFFSAEPFFRTKIYCVFFEELSAFFEAGFIYCKLFELHPNNYLKDIHIK
jgi:hypothetical protein